MIQHQLSHNGHGANAWWYNNQVSVCFCVREIIHMIYHKVDATYIKTLRPLNFPIPSIWICRVLGRFFISLFKFY